jgi:RHS repeat-associated protein
MAGRTRLARLGGKEPVQVAAGVLAGVPPALSALAATLLALALLFGLARAQVPARSAAALGSVCSLLALTTSGCNCGHSAGTVAPITATHYHGDHLGGTTVLTAQDGSVAAEIAYDPWGAEIVGATEPYAFTGKEYEPDTGLYDYAARVYDPVLARFLSPDPLAVFEPEKAIGEADQYNGRGHDPGTGFNDYGPRKAGPDLANPANFNRYSYALNNPYRFVDPTGHSAMEVRPDPLSVWAGQTAQTLAAVSVDDSRSCVTRSLAAVAGVVLTALDTENAGKTELVLGLGMAAMSAVPGGKPLGPHAPGEVPNGYVVVRGGQSGLPRPGTTMSGAQGTTMEEAASGVPHGTIRTTTAESIRAGGGTVEVAPELTRSGSINYRHVNVRQGSNPVQFSEPMKNPVPPKERIQ